ncbi:MAG: FkbM family methyltransferase [Beijerinckiaceae bacterium]
MLSYAQNMEDVLLSQLFPDKTDGFYIDVGGGHAVADNVTFHAYGRGWHGVVVEPQARLAALYARVRPRDHVVQALAGREIGELTLFEATTFHGLSTASTSHADAAEAAGVAGRRVTKPMTTLAALAAAHAPAVIDFLKIDVEGHEADVIAGGDWTRFRPQVIAVEAIEPLSMLDASHRFEPALLAAHYRFAFFDNLNRWYVAAEVSEEILPRFPKATLAWDNVQHLGEYGSAEQDSRHPDHALAKLLVGRFLAALPGLGDAQLAEWLGPDGAAATPAALARIASLHDGGYIVET